MFIITLLGFALGQYMEQQKQLTEAGCVIYTRFYMNEHQSLLHEPLQTFLASGMDQAEALLLMQAAGVEQCLDKISTAETMSLMQAMQSQNMKGFDHLLKGVNFKKFHNKNRASKKDEMLKIIKGIDDLLEGQKQQQQESGGNFDDFDNKPKTPIIDFSFMGKFKEHFIVFAFTVVMCLLCYIICCSPAKKPLKKKSVKEE